MDIRTLDLRTESAVAYNDDGTIAPTTVVHRELYDGGALVFAWDAEREHDTESDTHGAISDPDDITEVLALSPEEAAALAEWAAAIR